MLESLEQKIKISVHSLPETISRTVLRTHPILNNQWENINSHQLIKNKNLVDFANWMMIVLSSRY